MNKLIGTDQDGRPFLALVLEPGNLTRLREGMPIQFAAEEVFPEGILPDKLTIEIFLSETPVADAREFEKMAEVTRDERTPASKEKRPHCPECRSTVEQMGMMGNDTPVALAFCVFCGCVFGTFSGELYAKAAARLAGESTGP